MNLYVSEFVMRKKMPSMSYYLIKPFHIIAVKIISNSVTNKKVEALYA